MIYAILLFKNQKIVLNEHVLELMAKESGPYIAMSANFKFRDHSLTNFDIRSIITTKFMRDGKETSFYSLAYDKRYGNLT